MNKSYNIQMNKQINVESFLYFQGGFRCDYYIRAFVVQLFEHNRLLVQYID